ncbi:hypothetical protein TNCV_2458701 [Trichonephila clavipes]|nr:hypothetical protein TNCV_2458701 [Trichonephila clavipes]
MEEKLILRSLTKGLPRMESKRPLHYASRSELQFGRRTSATMKEITLLFILGFAHALSAEMGRAKHIPRSGRSSVSEATIELNTCWE